MDDDDTWWLSGVDGNPPWPLAAHDLGTTSSQNLTEPPPRHLIAPSFHSQAYSLDAVEAGSFRPVSVTSPSTTPALLQPNWLVGLDQAADFRHPVVGTSEDRPTYSHHRARPELVQLAESPCWTALPPAIQHATPTRGTITYCRAEQAMATQVNSWNLASFSNGLA
ncbi:uncharacterized protein B0I36DRAFT_356046 [Microdochium trichocladiopsis]|uniref:Uncharacterized protein n=1 Tax=Microdochium trichocladiopsis TaxID=1682393 RepID=A0A9P8XUG3_9PEZI|nr:uncharacterized protein B0I36DRAFT_356046 [Microdochium trichocladiopsis]KAH7012665.1 hypothetical protein B0I36DRAFT_356046 [Microdochium trichocladiopsis]